MDRDLNYYVRLPYAMIVAPQTATDGSTVWVAEHPELDGCMAHGDSQQEAIANLEDARRLYLETMLDDGLTPPEPQPTVAESTHAPMRAVFVLSFETAAAPRSPTPPLGIPFAPV